jgi:hypothetical protein
VGWKIIYDDDFAALEDWDNALPHISKKHRPVHGTVKHERRDHGAIPQAGDKRKYFPMPLRRIADQPLSARTATAQPHHAGARPGLVDKHQSGRGEHALLSHPAPARGRLRALLLRRVQTFFEADVPSLEEPPHRAAAAWDPFFPHGRNDFIQRQVGLLDKPKQ